MIKDSIWQAKTQTRCQNPQKSQNQRAENSDSLATDQSSDRARRDDRFFISDSAHFDSFFNEIEPHLEIFPNIDQGLFKVKGIKLKGADGQGKPRRENPKVLRRMAVRKARKERIEKRNQAAGIARNGPSNTGYNNQFKNEKMCRVGLRGLFQRDEPSLKNNLTHNYPARFLETKSRAHVSDFVSRIWK